MVIPRTAACHSLQRKVCNQWILSVLTLFRNLALIKDPESEEVCNEEQRKKMLSIA